MGYTHYFEMNHTADPAAFATLAADARRIVAEATDRGIALGDAFGNPGSSPLITDSEIRFNGIEPDNYETFSLAATDSGFNFCKTGPRPYDAAVCAVLIRAKVHLGDAIRVSSDGEWSWWTDGAALCQDLFGEAVCPFDLERSIELER